jgi:hypothetical protein
MSELLRKAYHYRQRAKECEQLAEWSASAKVMQQCLTAARRYLSFAEAEERVARGLAELDDTSRAPRHAGLLQSSSASRVTRGGG